MNHTKPVDYDSWCKEKNCKSSKCNLKHSYKECIRGTECNLVYCTFKHSNGRLQSIENYIEDSKNYKDYHSRDRSRSRDRSHSWDHSSRDYYSRGHSSRDYYSRGHSSREYYSRDYHSRESSEYPSQVITSPTNRETFISNMQLDHYKKLNESKLIEIQLLKNKIIELESDKEAKSNKIKLLESDKEAKSNEIKLLNNIIDELKTDRLANEEVKQIVTRSKTKSNSNKIKNQN